MALTAQEAREAAHFAEKYPWGYGWWWNTELKETIRLAPGYSTEKTVTSKSTDARNCLKKMQRYPELQKPGSCSPQARVALMRGSWNGADWEQAQQDLIRAVFRTDLPIDYALIGAYRWILDRESSAMAKLLREYADRLDGTAPALHLPALVPAAAAPADPLGYDPEDE